MQEAKVYRNSQFIGRLQKNDNGIYTFIYDKVYLLNSEALSISVHFPLQKEAFTSSILFAFFFNLLAEGVVKKMQCKAFKLDENDHFSRLIKTTQTNTIGSITLEETVDEML